jgi:hypothetical protein
MKTLGVLYLRERGNVRSAEIVYVEVDETRSQRNQCFRAFMAVDVPKEGEFIGIFDENGDLFWLER